MDRRSFLFYLPWVAASSKVAARSFVDLGAGRSSVLSEKPILDSSIACIEPSWKKRITYEALEASYLSCVADDLAHLRGVQGHILTAPNVFTHG